MFDPNLEVPAWVQRAWEQPLKKEDILFRSVSSAESEDDCETNAWVRGGNAYAYAEGYRRAGQILADHVIQNRWDTDFLVYPIMFLYRHNVELQVKRLIPLGASVMDQPINPADEKALTESHDLNRLWSIFKPILSKAAKGGLFLPVNDIDAIGSYIRQLHEIDQGSFAFRYVVTKTGAPSIDKEKLPHINVSVLAECMEKLTGYLFGLGEAFREAWDIKCEMEAEARAEMAQYYDGD